MTETPAQLPELRLKRGEDRRLSAGHLWVFSNEVDTARTPLPSFEPGALCRVVSDRDKFLGYAYVNPHSLICARILGRDPEHPPDKSLIVHRLQVAQSLRRALYDQPFYRLVYGESDALPGLVLDRFGDVIVGQIATAGMEAMRADVEAAVRKAIAPAAMLWKNDAGARELEGLPHVRRDRRSANCPSSSTWRRAACTFQLPLGGGQKTGWFFDQAANRLALRKYVGGARVLDVFSYLGAWGLGALRAGATEVTCVDSSAPALGRSAGDRCGERPEARDDPRRRVRRDGAAACRAAPLRCRRDRSARVHQAQEGHSQGRGRLSSASTSSRSSCSSATASWCRARARTISSRSSSLAAIQRGARHLDRFAQVVEVGGQAPDHPIHPAIPETRYLKAYFCRIVRD